MSNYLQVIRTFHRLSTEEMAMRLGVAESVVLDVESRNIKASDQLIEKCSSAFDIPVSNILFLKQKLENKENEDFLTKKLIGILEWIARDDNDCFFTKKSVKVISPKEVLN